MQLVVDPGGQIRTIYDEGLDLAGFGPLVIKRASHVEPDSGGCWHADLSPVGGPVLGGVGPQHRAPAGSIARDFVWSLGLACPNSQFSPPQSCQ